MCDTRHNEIMNCIHRIGESKLSLGDIFENVEINGNIVTSSVNSEKIGKIKHKILAIDSLILETYQYATTETSKNENTLTVMEAEFRDKLGLKLSFAPGSNLSSALASATAPPT